MKGGRINRPHTISWINCYFGLSKMKAQPLTLKHIGTFFFLYFCLNVSLSSLLISRRACPSVQIYGEKLGNPPLPAIIIYYGGDLQKQLSKGYDIYIKQMFLCQLDLVGKWPGTYQCIWPWSLELSYLYLQFAVCRHVLPTFPDSSC